MPNNTNSASRLHSIFAKIHSIPDQTSALAGWVEILKINESNPNKKTIAVARGLDKIYTEISLVKQGMLNRNFTPSLYENALNSFEEASSPLLLSGSWTSVRQYIKPQNLISLQFCGELLPDEETTISQEELDNISKIVRELHLSATKDSIPEDLRKIILHHTEIIQQSIDDYKISGVKAFRQAIQAGVGELIESKEIITANNKSNEVSQLATVWKRINSVADSAIKLDRVLHIGNKAWDMIENICQIIS